MSVNLGTAYAELVLNSKGFTAGMAEAQASLQTFKSQAGLVASGLEGVGTAMTKVGSSLTKTVTAPIVGLGTAAIKTGMDFDEGMSRVAAISGATGDDLEKLRNKAREMGATTKFTATESAEALNYMAMAGWKTEEMLDGLEGVMYLAAASGEDLGTTSDIVTDAITAFGLSAKDSSHFADVLAASAANSNTTVSMLGESFKFIAPVAGAMNYNIEDVAVSLGLMANSGIKAGMSGRALRNILTNMAKPTDEVAAAMDYLGLSLQDDEGNMKSLQDVMKDLRNAFGNTNITAEEYQAQVEQLDEALANKTITTKQYEKELETLNKQCFNNVDVNKAMYAATLAGKQGMAGLLAIVNSTDEDFESLNNSIYSASDGMGMAAQQAAIMMDNLKGKITILKSALQELGIEIYEILLPHVDSMVSKIQDLVKWFQELSTEQKEQIVKWAGIAAAIGPVLLIVGKLLTSLGTIISSGIKISSWLGAVVKAFGLVSAGAEGASAGVAALGASFGWIAAVVAAVAGLGIALKKLYDENGQFTESVNSFKDKVVEDFKALIEEVKQAWESFKAFIQPAIDTIKNSFNFDAVDGAMSKLVDAFSRLYDSLKPVISFIKDVLVAVLGPILLNLLSTTVGVINGIINALAPLINVLTDVINIVSDVVDVVVGIFEGIFTGNFDKLKKAIGNLGNDLISLISDLWDTIVALVTGFLEGFGATFNSFTGGLLSDIGSSLEKIWNKVKTFFTVTVPQGFDKFKKTIVDFFTVTIPKAIESFLTETIPNFINSVVKWFEQLPYKIGYAIGYVLETIRQWGSDLIDWVKTEVPKIIDGIIDFFKELPGKIWNWLVNTYNKMLEWQINMTKSAIETGKEFLNRIIDFFKELPGKVWDWLVNTINKILEWQENMRKAAIETATEFVNNVVEFVKELPDKFIAFIKSIPDKILALASDFKEAGKHILSSMWDGLKEMWDSISDWFDGIWEDVKNFLKGIKDGMSDAREASEGSHADGLAYVPYNGYRATLHEGERVLTKNEAQNYGSAGSAYTINIYSPTQVDPYEANRIFKNTVRELEEGFA